jgi:hypothetical protein
MATKAQTQVDDRMVARLLRYAKAYFPESGHDVDAVSAIVWMLVDQDIAPEVLDEMDEDTITAYFGQVCDINAMECDDIGTDADRQDTALGKRWRSVRYKVIRALL